MKLADIKRWLKQYDENKLKLTNHVKYEKCPYYGISPKVVMENLLNPKNLVAFKKATINIEESKYKLYFQISRQRTLAIVVEFNEKLRIITIYPIINKWQKRLRSKWKR